MIGFDVSERTVLRWMRRAPRSLDPAKMGCSSLSPWQNGGEESSCWPEGGVGAQARRLASPLHSGCLACPLEHLLPDVKINRGRNMSTRFLAPAGQWLRPAFEALRDLFPTKTPSQITRMRQSLP